MDSLGSRELQKRKAQGESLMDSQIVEETHNEEASQYFEEIQKDEAHYSFLRALVDLRSRQIQKARIQFGNRMSSIKSEADPANGQQEEIIGRYLTIFADLEKMLDKDIARVVKREPIYRPLSQIKGIGPMMAAYLLAFIDINKAPTVSALWRYAGMAVFEGQREKPVKGEKLHYNARLKTALFLLAGSFLKSDSPYARLYGEARQEYDIKKPDWSKLHCHLAANRKMVKVFLSHLWLKWRELENLPITAPYIFAGEENHHTYLKPEDFGW